MDVREKRPGSINALLVGLILACLLAAGLLVPWFKCAVCWKDYKAARDWADASAAARPEMTAELERNIPRHCWNCGGRYRVSLYHLLFGPLRAS